MKKALQITIAGTLFTIEDDAFQELHAYLESINIHFSKFPDSKDIVDDIEARIAEQLLESQKNSGQVITLQSVKSVIETMGSVEKISDETEHFSDTTRTQAKSTSPNQSRKLFRNPDNTVIAGVASGLAIYLNIDPLIVRIVFIFLAFVTSGSFIFIYIIAALVIPKAETATDKIKMYGGPVTLDSFKETMNDSTAHSQMPSSHLREILESVIDTFGKIIRFTLKIITKIGGLFLKILSLIMLVGITFMLLNILFNTHSHYIEFPIRDVIGAPLYFLMIFLAYITVAIPIIFIFFLGTYLMNWKHIFNLKAVVILVSIWITVGLIFSTLAIHFAPEVYHAVESLPQYQTVTHAVDVKPFTKINAEGTNDITLVQGTLFSVVENGRQVDLDTTDTSVSDNTLTISELPNPKICILCQNREPVHITITAPTIESITLNGLIHLTSESIDADQLELHLSNFSSTALTLNTEHLVIDEMGTSRAIITGTTTTLHLETNGVSHFDGSNLVVQEAEVETQGVSAVTLHVLNTLTATAYGASTITYSGNPILLKSIYGMAHIGTGTPATTSPLRYSY